MSEANKYRNQHILLLIISFCVSAFIFLLFNDFSDPVRSQNDLDPLKISPDLVGLQSISSEKVKDEFGNPIGDAFIYSRDGDLYLTLTTTEEKQIETACIKLTQEGVLSNNSIDNSILFDFSWNKQQPKKIKEVVIPIGVIEENTHLISTVQTTNENDGGRRTTGSAIFHPQLIQAIFH